MDIKIILAEVRKNNPYPKTVFLERSNEDWEKLHKLCNENGLCLDGFMGDHGRRVWDNCIDEILKAMKEDINDIGGE